MKVIDETSEVIVLNHKNPLKTSKYSLKFNNPELEKKYQETLQNEPGKSYTICWSINFHHI